MAERITCNHAESTRLRACAMSDRTDGESASRSCTESVIGFPLPTTRIVLWKISSAALAGVMLPPVVGGVVDRVRGAHGGTWPA